MGWHANKKDPRRKKYTVVGKDHLGIQRQMPAFRDASLSRELARNIARLVEHRANNTPLPPLLAAWFNNLAPAIHNRLAEWDLLDGHARPLVDHLKDYEASLAARDNTARYVQQTVSRIQKVIEGCGFRYWSDVTGSDTQRIIDGMMAPKKKTASPQTKNYYLADFKAFFRWAVREGRLPRSPVAHLRPIEANKVRSDRRHERRALSVEESRKLLATTAQGPTRCGMTGPERALAYRLCIETGLRVGRELQSLTSSSFQLDGAELSVVVESGYTKNRRQAVIPIRPKFADELRPFLSKKLPSTPMFRLPTPNRRIQMLREDLKAAGIPYRDEADRVVDWHALRHTCGTLLAAAGVYPKVIQRIMRHSTITLTMDRYTHVFRSDETAAIARLPDLRPEPRDAQRSRGTDIKAGCVAGYRGWTEVDQGDTSVDSRTDRAHAENRDQTPVAQGKAAFKAAGGKRPRWDSNPRITDLQSVPLVHLGTRPDP